MKKTFFTTANIAAMGALTAIVVVLTLFSNYITIGPVNITLALIPIVVGALIYGPLAGGFLGLVNGAMVLTAPSTISVFFPINAWATVLVCLVKTTVAGLVAGLIFLPFKKKNSHILLGSILASISVPLINTSLFGVGFLLFFHSMSGDQNSFEFLIITVIGWNFFIEFAVNSILSPTVYRIYQAVNNRYFGE